MNAARRARQKAYKDHPAHVKIEDPAHPGHFRNERCTSCRPLPFTQEQRDARSSAAMLGRAQAMDHADPARGVLLRMMARRRGGSGA